MDKKIFTIEINGIKESIEAVASLKRQLEELSNQILQLENKKINIQAEVSINADSLKGVTTSSSNGSSNVKTLSEEAALQKELNSLKNEGIKLDAKIAASQDEVYKRVQATKDIYKEAVNDQKMLAAQERLTANAYANTMQGMKDKLADLKTVINSTDLGDNDIIKKMTAEANDLTNKLKEMETAYGQFGRNVGNYGNATESLNKFKIEVGAVTREFGSAREASRTLKQELTQLEMAGKHNTEEAKNLRRAYNELDSSMKDATVSSKAMDNALDTMQSFTAAASVGKGIQAFFGLDSGEIGRSVQQLLALQGVLQGIEMIKKQMDTREGLFGLLGKGYEKVDTWTYGLKKVIVQIKGTGTAAQTATVAVKALGVALKSLMTLGIAAAITLIAEGLQLVITKTKDWVDGNQKLVSSEKLLNGALDVINFTLEKRLQLNQQLLNAGYYNQVDKEIADEKAYAAAIEATNAELNKRKNYNQKNSSFAQGMQTGGDGNAIMNSLANDKGVTTVGGFSQGIKSVDELYKRYNLLSEAVAKNTELIIRNGQGVEDTMLTASDARDELNHLEQFLGGAMVGAFQKFDLSTQEGRRGLADFVNGIMNSDDTINKSILLRLPEIVDNNKGAFGTALQKYLDLIKQFVSMANSETLKLNFEGMVEGILDQADETGKRITERRKAELTQRYEMLSKEEQFAEKKNYDAAMAALDKMQKRRNMKITNSLRKDRQAYLKADDELNRLRIEKMNEGFAKQLALLEEERRQKLAKARADGIKVKEMELAINELYDKKILDVQRENAREIADANEDMWRSIINSDVEASEKELEVYRKRNDLILKQQEEISQSAMNQDIGSYGIQGKEQLTPSTQESLAIVSTIKNDSLIEETKKLIDAEREYNITLNNLTLLREENAKEEQDLESELIKAKAKANEELKALDERRTSITAEEYEARKEALTNEYQYELETMEKYEEEREKLESMQTSMSQSEYNKQLKALRLRYDETFKSYGEFKEKMEKLDFKMKYDPISDEEYEAAKTKREKEIASKEKELEQKKKQHQQEIELYEMAAEAKRDNLDRINEFIQGEYEAEDIERTKNLLQQEGYTKDLSTLFNQRMSAIEAYWTIRINQETEYAEGEAEIEKELAEKKHKQAIDAENAAWREQEQQQEEYYKKRQEYIKGQAQLEINELKERLDKKQISQQEYDSSVLEINNETNRELNGLQDEYNKAAEDAQASHQMKMLQIDGDYEAQVLQIDTQTNEKRKSLNTEYYNNSLEEIQKFRNSITELEGKSQVNFKVGNVDLGFTNWGATIKNNKELLKSYDELVNKINGKKKKLNEDLANGLIDRTTYETTLTELDGFAQGVGEKMDEAKEKMSGWNIAQTIAQESQQYIQGLGNMMTSILSSMWDAEDAAYEKEKEDLEKQIDLAKESYDKMDEAAREHADNMKSIEGDIAAAQGDARDRLIQRYNAEKQAQKEALKEKKKAEKEQEKLEKQKEELDKKQREKQKERDLITAAINMAMSISMAAVNTWPVPAIPMMAMAAAVGAAQIAAIQSKQYAQGGQLDGGVAVGKRHINGGIKVLGGQAEIEGGEFVTNRLSTEKNVALLEFINSRKKRVNLDDMIEFYVGKTSKVSSTIANAAGRTKFADGGALPIMSTSYSNNDMLATALERYANRPQYVSVVDIIDKSQDVNEVKVMAGLGE